MTLQSGACTTFLFGTPEFIWEYIMYGPHTMELLLAIPLLSGRILTADEQIPQ